MSWCWPGMVGRSGQGLVGRIATMPLILVPQQKKERTLWVRIIFSYCPGLRSGAFFAIIVVFI